MEQSVFARDAQNEVIGVLIVCGFAGFLDSRGFPRDGGERLARTMASTLNHRGPDSSGSWSDPRQGIALGHRRLKILDVSPAGGRQPMVSKSGRYVIAFNGEIYNYTEIRAQLACQSWVGTSDTEVLLQAIEQWGISASLRRAVGMFAFALWDCDQCKLYLARDRLGEKPLYFGFQGGVFMFASEIKALIVHPSFEGRVNREALSPFLMYGYIPAPQSIYRGIEKLLPGKILSVSLGSSEFETETFWSVKETVVAGKSNRFEGDETAARNELDRHLSDSVRIQMIADVPLGAFLSGGIDSSTVVSLMQKQSTDRIKTFTIGFDEEVYDESRYARAISDHLGTDHEEMIVTAREAREVIPSLPEMFDEPFADASAIPTFLVSKLAKTRVTVSLSGDGGDELFCGYDRYGRTQEHWSRLNLLPRVARKMLVTARFGLAGSKRDRFANMLSSKSENSLYQAMASQWPSPNSVLRGVDTNKSCVANLMAACPSTDFREKMMFTDSLTYLPDCILQKVDRASMQVSLETRVPMLDHRVVEFSWQLPLRMKVRGRENKWLLKRVLEMYVPKELTSRPKMGFGLPIHTWLRGPLNEWAEELISQERLVSEGFFCAKRVRKAWRGLMSGDDGWRDPIWIILMFQAWNERRLHPFD